MPGNRGAEEDEQAAPIGFAEQVQPRPRPNCLGPLRREQYLSRDSSIVDWVVSIRYRIGHAFIIRSAKIRQKSSNLKSALAITLTRRECKCDFGGADHVNDCPPNVSGAEMAKSLPDQIKQCESRAINNKDLLQNTVCN